MSAKEKMQAIANTIGEKTKEYTPIVKEKIAMAYTKTKAFTMNIVLPKVQEGIESAKGKIADFQAKRAEKTPKKPD